MSFVENVNGRLWMFTSKQPEITPDGTLTLPYLFVCGSRAADGESVHWVDEGALEVRTACCDVPAFRARLKSRESRTGPSRDFQEFYQVDDRLFSPLVQVSGDLRGLTGRMYSEAEIAADVLSWRTVQHFRGTRLPLSPITRFASGYGLMPFGEKIGFVTFDPEVYYLQPDSRRIYRSKLDAEEVHGPVEEDVAAKVRSEVSVRSGGVFVHDGGRLFLSMEEPRWDILGSQVTGKVRLMLTADRAFDIGEYHRPQLSDALELRYALTEVGEARAAAERIASRLRVDCVQLGEVSDLLESYVSGFRGHKRNLHQCAMRAFGLLYRINENQGLPKVYVDISNEAKDVAESIRDADPDKAPLLFRQFWESRRGEIVKLLKLIEGKGSAKGALKELIAFSDETAARDVHITHARSEWVSFCEDYPGLMASTVKVAVTIREIRKSGLIDGEEFEERMNALEGKLSHLQSHPSLEIMAEAMAEAEALAACHPARYPSREAAADWAMVHRGALADFSGKCRSFGAECGSEGQAPRA